VIAARNNQRTNASTRGKENVRTMSTAKTTENPRRPQRLVCAIALAALGALFALASPAAAKVVHLSEGSFSAGGSVSGLAVDNSGGAGNGDVWVATDGLFQANGAVRKLEEDGTPTGVEFTGAITPAGTLQFLDFATFTFADSLAVDSSAGANTGDLYVADAAHQVVDRFSEAGAYECQITGKATPSASECGTNSEVPGGGGFTPAGVAVDQNDGHVFVVDGVTQTIFEFNEAGEYEGEISDAHLTLPGSLDFDAAGDLYVANGSPFLGGQSVVKFDSSGSYEATLTSSGEPFRLAVDRGNGHVYVGSESLIRDFTPGGSEVSSFGGPTGSLSANGTSSRVYSGFGGSVSMYSGPQTVPDPIAKPATNVEEVTATVNGEVDPDLANGGTEVESCEFEYGTTTAYGESTPCSPATPYASTQAISAGLNSLASSTTYHFRIKAENEDGIASYSGDETLITKGPPSVASESADNISRSGAELHAQVNPHGYATEYVFEYVTQAHYEAEGFTGAQTTAPKAIGSSQSPVAVAKTISGLSVETSYHYRAKATSSHGAVPGEDKSFATVAIAEIEAQYAVVLIHRAKLEVDVNPLGLDTNCHAEYVSDAAFQESGYAGASTVPCEPEDLGEGNGRVTAKAYLEGLDLTKPYHYRFVVQNSSGTVIGEDKEFIPFGITEFTVEALEETEFEEPRNEGEHPFQVHPVNPVPVTQAGAHPWILRTKIEMPSTPYREESDSITGIIKDILTELPPGLIGNPEAVPKCPIRVIEEKECSGDSEVGEAFLWYGREIKGAYSRQIADLYNSTAPQGVAARFAGEFNVSTDGYIDSGIRTGGDYGVNAGATDLTNTVSLRGIEVQLWGVPADPSHDLKRNCNTGQPGGCASNAEPKPFLRMPTSCPGSPLTVAAKVDSFNEPGEFVHASSEMPAMTGCNQLEFAPSIEARPTTTVADSPSGLHIDIKNPQNEDPYGLATPDVKDVSVALPEGMRVNPASANGLEGCTPSQADLHSSGPGHCPDSAKIGTAEVDTPLLDHPLKGSMFLATPHVNPFNSLLATYIALEDEQSGVIVKLAGEVKSDPDTGRLTATFKDNPQQPFNDFKVDLFSGALAPLRTPGSCGTYSTHSSIVPWSAPDSGPPSTPQDTYKIESGPNGSGCDESNSPSFSSGTESPIAAKYSPFVVRLSRDDGSQEFKDVTITPPAGLVARLAGTPYCSDAALGAAAGRSGQDEKANSSCSSASEIGTVHVAAGAGPSPYWVTGHAYLAGPYQGAPLSMAIITPATAGPFDLGTVVVRSALHVDPVTTQITAITDEIPHILEGIPLDIRQANVILDKPGFTLNPTSCDATSIGGQLVSVLNQSASLSDRFQVGDCTSLSFEPKLGLRLYGKTNRGAHPKFRAVLVMPEGGANISEASVRLPRSEILDQGHIRTVCTRVQFAADSCPQGSIYGYARAWSPLLDQPLQGLVYLRSSSHKLPDLVADLNGQIHVEVAGRIDSVKGGIRNTFEAVPDAPVSKFVLFMKGGAKGLLQNSTNICKGTHRAVSLFDAHSGAVHDIRPALNNGRCRHKRKRHKRHHRKGAAKRSSVAVASRAG